MKNSNALTQFLIPVDIKASNAEAVALMRCLATTLDERIEKITLLHVTGGRYLSEHMANIDARAARLITTELFKKIRQDHIDKEIMPVLEDVKKQLEQNQLTVPIDILIEDGNPVDRIVEHANTGGYSSLIIERQSRSHTQGLGGVASGVLHRDVRATIYLTGIRPIECPPHCLLVALDGSKNSWMALERAGVLGAACGDSLEKIVLVSVIDVADYSMQLAEGKEEASMDYSMLEKGEEKLVAAGVDKERIVKRLCGGDPADVLVREVKDHDAEVIFMGRRDRGKLQELFMGSVSTNLINHCPEQTLVMFAR